MTTEPQAEMSQEEKLRVELETAVKNEEYETAAKLRDQIKKLKGES